MKKIVFLALLFCFQSLFAQNSFTRKDSLQGGLPFARTCYDVLHYGLNIKINIEEKKIVGYNEIRFKVIANTQKIQLDLFENMQIDSIVFHSKKLNYKREHHAVFVEFSKILETHSEEILRFYYSGHPIIAKNAPWDGGFVFTKDRSGKPWIGVAVQGTGASLWYPCKDSQSDEPNHGATIKVAVPNGVMNVSNGRLKGFEDLKNGYTRWDWEVKNPINNYDITVNIADYVHLHDQHHGLDLDYYVLRENEEKAKKHFEEVKPMMDCFQSKFGTYPFVEDGYKLVETPYLGMEHQSAVAYGNKYKKGYLGMDRSGAGIGLSFDFITIHESGHEWFGNSITAKDIADMWIHEGFTTYSEAVFLECTKGYADAQKYINGSGSNIQNDSAIIGQYGVNNEGSSDMYNKGALLINTLRHIINNDEKWWKILLDFSTTYKHEIIDTQTVVDFFNKKSGINLTPVFDQYLRYTAIPILELKKNKNKIFYRWKTDVNAFSMPIDVKINRKEIRLEPSNIWQTLKAKVKNLNEIEVAKNKFFVEVSLQEEK